MLNITIDERHRYFVNGERVQASVTGVIGLLDKSAALMGWVAKLTAEYFIEIIPMIQNGSLKLSKEDIPALIKQAKQEYKKKQKEACNIGTEVHAAIENYELRKEMPFGLTPEGEKAFDAFLSWQKKENLGEVICAEMPIYSDYEYCGQIDKIQYYKNKVYLIDYKTSKDFYEPTMPMQLAAYKNAYNYTRKKNPNNDMPEIEGLGILRLDKATGMPYFKDYTEWEQPAFQMFISLLDIFYLQKQMKELK